MSAVSAILRFIGGIGAFFCIIIVIVSIVGLCLQGIELIIGEEDFSKWLIMSAAEKPTKELLLRGGLAIMGSIIFGLMLVLGEKIE